MFIDRDFMRSDKRRRNSPRVECSIRYVGRHNGDSESAEIVVCLESKPLQNDESATLRLTIAEAVEFRAKLDSMIPKVQNV